MKQCSEVSEAVTRKQIVEMSVEKIAAISNMHMCGITTYNKKTPPNKSVL